MFAKVLSRSEKKKGFTLIKLASLVNFVNSYRIRRAEDFITGSARILFSFNVVFHITNPVGGVAALDTRESTDTLLDQSLSSITPGLNKRQTLDYFDSSMYFP